MASQFPSSRWIVVAFALLWSVSCRKAEPVVKMQTPRGETAYWIGAAGSAQDAGPGTDFHAVASGRVSVTPLQIDLSRHQQLPAIAAWLADGDGG